MQWDWQHTHISFCLSKNLACNSCGFKMNKLTSLTSAHLWCVSTVETFLVCMSSAGKVHTPMSVWSPHHMDDLTTHTYVSTLCIHVHSMCRVHIGACVVGSWTATCNGTKILTQCSVAHTGQRCLHTTLLCPCHMHQSRRPGPHGPLLTFPYTASLSCVDKKFNVFHN